MLNFGRREIIDEEILDLLRDEPSDGWFSRSEPWSSLGLLRRITRVCRIVFGLLLFSAILLLTFPVLRGLSFGSSVWQALFCVAAIPYLALLAWCVGCMFIWRGVYPPSQLSAGGSPPPEPPADGAPRPSPLLPYTPLTLSAHCELPNDHTPTIEVDVPSGIPTAAVPPAELSRQLPNRRLQ